MGKLFAFFTIPLILFFGASGVYAQSDPNYAPVGSAPANCPNDFETDFSCSRAKILDPSTVCFENKCPDAPSYSQIQAGVDGEDIFSNFDAFGVRFNIDSSERIAAVINIAISTILGFVSLYALGRGVYVAGFKIAGTIQEETIAESQKELVQLVIGFVIAWTFILVLQIFFSILGLGSINEYILLGEQENQTNIVIN